MLRIIKYANNKIVISFTLVVSSLFIPFKKTTIDSFSLGYPLGFLTFHIKYLHGVSCSKFLNVFDFMSLNLLTLLIDVLFFYFIISLFDKIRKKLKNL